MPVIDAVLAAVVAVVGDVAGYYVVEVVGAVAVVEGSMVVGPFSSFAGTPIFLHGCQS